MTAGALLHRAEVHYLAEIHLQAVSYQSVQFLLRIIHRPFIEVRRFQVIVVQNVLQRMRVLYMAIRVFHAFQIGMVHIVPAIFKLIGTSAATLAEARVTDGSIAAEDFSTCGPHGLFCPAAQGTRDALITLAMVIGTHIEQLVFLPVIPADGLGIGSLEREEGMVLLFLQAAVFQLGKQPAATDDGRCLQVLQATGRLHLAADNTGQIVLHRQAVDDENLVFVHHQVEHPTESLRLAPLPVELHSYGNIRQREGGLLVFGPERQFPVQTSLPQDASVLAFHRLHALHRHAFGHIDSVGTEDEALFRQQTHAHLGLLSTCQQAVRPLVLRHRGRGCRRIGKLCNHGLQLVIVQCDLPQDVSGTLECDPFKILTAGRNDESAHVQSTRTDEQLVLALLAITIGAVLGTRKNQCHNLVGPAQSALLMPGDKVHPGFFLTLRHRKCLVHTLAKDAVRLGGLAADNKHRAHIGA